MTRTVGIHIYYGLRFRTSDQRGGQNTRALFIRLFRLIYFCVPVLLICGLLTFPRQVSEVCTAALSVCANILIPSLFPFFIASSLIISSGLADFLGLGLKGFMRLVFNLPGSCSAAFLLGMLSGFPVGANTALRLYQSGRCSKSEAERLLAFCNNTGPAFVLGAVGAGIWKNAQAGILLYICQIVASITTGVLFRFYGRRGGRRRSSRASSPAVSASSSPATAFVGAVKTAAESMLTICAFVVFFAVLNELLTLMKAIPFLTTLLCRLLPLDRTVVNNLISGFFEVTAGVRGAGIGSASALVRLTATGAILGWAGLSVHCQVLSFLSGSGLRATPYILGKFIQSVLAAFFTFLAAQLYPIDIAAFASKAVSMDNLELQSFRSMLLLSSAIIVLYGVIFSALFLVVKLKEILYNKVDKG